MSNVSYELRTPLTNILGFAESLSLGIAGEMLPKQREYLRDIQTSSQDLLTIIDAILDLTTIDAGAMELRLEEIDVIALMQETAKAADVLLSKRDVTLSVELADDAAAFTADPKRVRQILQNLLVNAIGFSSQGQTVRMKGWQFSACSKPDWCVTISSSWAGSMKASGRPNPTRVLGSIGRCAKR